MSGTRKLADQAAAPPTPEQARAADLNHQASELADNPRDVTVEGGRYEVGGQIVDANGKPLKGGKSESDA